MIGGYETGLMMIMLFCWLIPITYVGTFKSKVSFFPVWLNQQTGIACLFTGHSEYGRSFYIQVQSPDYSGWVTVPESDYFQMYVFGYRTRMFRILIHANRGKRAARAVREVGLYIRQQHAQTYPDKAPLTAVRFARLSTSIQDLAKQEGHYYKPPLESADPDLIKLYGELRWDGQPPTHPGLQRQWRMPRRDATPTLSSEEDSTSEILD